VNHIQSCALNAWNTWVHLRRQWSCVGILCSQNRVGNLQDMPSTSGRGCGCGCSSSWKVDCGKHSRSVGHLYRIARVGIVDDINEQNSNEVVDSRGRRCTRQSRPQFRCIFRDASSVAREDSIDPRAWMLRTNKVRYRTELAP
jgi:hypothetical protein